MTLAPQPPNKSRFDLDSQASGTETSTLKELIAEINAENKPSIHGTLVTIQTLGPLLRCVERITGRRTTDLKLKTPLPIASLRALKALHVANVDSHVQLFQLIDPPYRGGRATFEVRTTGRALRAEQCVGLIHHLLERLRTAVDPKRLARIDQVLLTRSQVLECMARENVARALIVRLIAAEDQGWVASAWTFLADWTSRQRVPCQRGANDLVESLYTYLRNLEFFHYATEYSAVQRLARVADPIHPIFNELTHFCTSLGLNDNRVTSPTTPILTLSSVQPWAERHAAGLAKLVHRCTKLPVRRDTIRELASLATKILDVCHLHLYEQAATDAPYVSIADVVAALCVIRYQRHKKTRYKPYWLGQTDQGSNVLRHLHRGKSLDELHRTDYIPEGVNQILHCQYNQFYGVIAECKELLDSRSWFEQQYLQKYSECLQSNDIDLICDAINALDRHVDNGVTFVTTTRPPLTLVAAIREWQMNERNSPARD